MNTKNETFIKKNWWQLVLLFCLVCGQISSYAQIKNEQINIKSYIFDEFVKKEDYNITKEKVLTIEKRLEAINNKLEKIIDILLKK